MNKGKSEGITLIALVITIIILLILAGVSLSLVMGEEGLIGRTISAKEVNENAEEKELVELAVSTAQIDGKGTITIENLNDALKEILKNDTKASKNGVGWTYQGKKTYVIYENGKVEEIREGQIILPSEYKQVEYIESTGTQYIDTGIIPNLNIGMSISILDFEKKSWNTLLGSVTAYKTSSRYRISTEEEKLYAFLGDKIKIEIPDFDNIQIDFNNPIGKVRFNGLEYNVTNTSFSSSNLPITIFAENNSSDGVRQFSNVKMKKIQIYDGDTKVRDFIPCYCTTLVTDKNNKQCSVGTRGLYDLVTEEFYTNQGTGADFNIPEE